jgi:hypothetical protein
VRAHKTRAHGRRRASEHTTTRAPDYTRRTHARGAAEAWPAVRPGRAAPAKLKEGSETERIRRKEGRRRRDVRRVGYSGRPPAHGWLSNRRLLRYALRLRSQRLGCMRVCVSSTACVCARVMYACVCVCLLLHVCVHYVCIASESVDWPNHYPIYNYHRFHNITLYSRCSAQRSIWV